MTRTVIANFTNAEAARRAVVALGRTELAAGPTRVQAAAGTDQGARLELRVEPADTPRAIALLREHGAEVTDREEAGADLRTGASPLAGWGMAVADAVTAAMGGATASDAQVPAGDGAGDGSSDAASRPATDRPRR